MTLIDLAYERALEVLDACISPRGMKASGFSDGYPQVWARDSSVTFLGASLAPSAKIQESFQASLATLSEKQNEIGQIPTGVDSVTGSAGYGSMDNNPWYLLAMRTYQLAYGDNQLVDRYADNIRGAVTWLRYQEIRNDGLLYSPEAADWNDLLCNHGHVLFTNVLYAGALRAAAAMLKGKDDAFAEQAARKAEETRRLVNLRLWIEDTDEQQAEVDKNFGDGGRDYRAIRGVGFTRPYYLPYVSFRDWGDWLDGLGNSLAILLDVADARKADLILTWMHSMGMDMPYPIRVLDPVIEEGSKDWREYYRNFGLNRPHQYHNGGIWPFVGGFYVAALVKAGRHEAAAKALEGLAEANRQGKEREWEFNEWLHGVSGRPVGNRWQAWSAGMYVYAWHAVKNKVTPYFPY